jgi:RHS repeat-associated protein
MRSTANWTDYAPGSEPVLFVAGRGFTGHEHLPWFNMINMNGRVYDPLTGQFLSPDNNVQSPDFTLNFNRYAYCLNNPLIYTDPDGEFFLGTILTFFGDLINTAFFKGGLDPTSKTARQNAWKDFDPSASWSATNKAWKIDIGGFKGSFGQILSRWTWELPQTLIGKGYSHFSNIIGQVSAVDYYGGSTVVKCYGNYIPLTNGNATGVTFGSFIIGNNTIEADPNNTLFQHEYGHYLQSQAVGWAYLPGYGLPSLWGDSKMYGHDYNPIEQDANARAIKYFYNRIGYRLTWNFNRNPIGFPGTNWTMSDYSSPGFQSLLRSLKIKPKWYDYFSWLTPIPGVLLSGWYHSYNYRMHPINHE